MYFERLPERGVLAPILPHTSCPSTPGARVGAPDSLPGLFHMTRGLGVSDPSKPCAPNTSGCGSLPRLAEVLGDLAPQQPCEYRSVAEASGEALHQAQISGHHNLKIDCQWAYDAERQLPAFSRKASYSSQGSVWSENDTPQWTPQSSPGPCDLDDRSRQTPPYLRRGSESKVDTTHTKSRRRVKEERRHSKSASQTPGEKPKRNTTKYTDEQMHFINYFKDDIGLKWNHITEIFYQRFPELPRNRGGLQCVYYRRNKAIPVLDQSGLLILDPPMPEAAKQEAKRGGEEEENKSVREYKGVRYQAREVQVRENKVPLRERFPEEIVNPENKWVRTEDRMNPTIIALANKRRAQREAHVQAREYAEYIPHLC